MRIERINESQIRCTLNVSDLRERHLTLMELAYGNDKARALFHEMIERAGDEFGFQADDLPLMIEAIPLSGDGIMLIISKIDAPDELDTRFAKFAPGLHEDAEGADEDAEFSFRRSAGDILNALNQMLSESQGSEPPEDNQVSAIFRFAALETVCEAASILGRITRSENSLYKSPLDGGYYLALHKGEHTPEEFNKICNVLTEYSDKISASPAAEAYYEEHYESLLPERALQSLAGF